MKYVPVIKLVLVTTGFAQGPDEVRRSRTCSTILVCVLAATTRRDGSARRGERCREAAGMREGQRIRLPCEMKHGAFREASSLCGLDAPRPLSGELAAVLVAQRIVTRASAMARCPEAAAPGEGERSIF